MKMMWIRSPALNEHVGTFSSVSPSLSLPKGTGFVWLEQVGEDLPMVVRGSNETEKGTEGVQWEERPRAERPQSRAAQEQVTEV